jgi:hypothetical protein
MVGESSREREEGGDRQEEQGISETEEWLSSSLPNDDV